MKPNEFDDLLKSIDQAREIAKGVKTPSRLFKFEPMEVKNIRGNLKISQPQFANMIGISVGTLRNWEQGRTYPEGPAIILLKLVEEEPEFVYKTIHKLSARRVKVSSILPARNKTKFKSTKRTLKQPVQKVRR